MMITAKDLNYIGKKGLMGMDGLQVQVRVLNARARFGIMDFLVTPTRGGGQKWVESSRVRLDLKRGEINAE